MCAESSARLNCATGTEPLEAGCGVLGRSLGTNELVSTCFRRSDGATTEVECRVPSAECECRMPRAACACACACRVPSAECRVPRATCRVRSAECGVPRASASARRNALHKTQLVLTNVLDPRPIDATSHRTNVARRTNRRRPHRTLSRNVRGIIARSRGCSSRALRPRLLALEHVGRPRRVVHSASNNRGIESRVGDSRRSMLVSS